MAAMTTALTEFSDKDNSRVYTLSDHTVSLPSLVLQQRKLATGSKVVSEDEITVLKATVDADGLVMPQKVAISVVVKRPIGHLAADMTSVLATLRDIVAGDEFGNTVLTQEYLS